ncbi:MAG: cytochrome P460 family protein [Nitrospirae bacterium]|nr:cytochrome P460 family protein [Nitrospirota bacterium]
MKKNIVIVSLAVLVVIAAFAAYAGDPAPIKVIPYDSVFKHMPWAAGGDVRYHITIHKPYTKWAKWPGKGEMYAGKEPHGSFLTTYVNEIALDSINKAAGMSDNSIIVKENYDSNKQLAAVTVMYKVKGYNPAGNDWFWAKYDPKFNILAEGKAEDCIKCHTSAKDNDYIFTGKVTGK